MNQLIREAVAGLMVRLGRAAAFLIVCSSLGRRYPAAELTHLPTHTVIQPPVRVEPENPILKSTAADVERLVNRKLGWE